MPVSTDSLGLNFCVSMHVFFYTCTCMCVCAGANEALFFPGQNTSIHLILNPLKPSALPECKFLGPEHSKAMQNGRGKGGGGKGVGGDLVIFVVGFLFSVW